MTGWSQIRCKQRNSQEKKLENGVDFIAKNYVSLFKNNTSRALSNLQSTRVE